MTPPAAAPARRTTQVMLRFFDDEWAAVAARLPPRTKAAVFLRDLVLRAVGPPPADAPCTRADLRRATVFLAACLSEDVTLGRAGELYDLWAGERPAGEGGDGERDEGRDDRLPARPPEVAELR